jgi:hypothetical protein
MISCNLYKFFFNLPKIEGGFYACQTTGPLTQRGAVETADATIYADAIVSVGVAATERASSGLELMRITTVVWATAAALLGAGLGTSAARADEPINVGKWEFTVLVPGVTHLPPELLQQYPAVRVGPNGMTISHTECTSSDNPLPAMVPWHGGRPLLRGEQDEKRASIRVRRVSPDA